MKNSNTRFIGQIVLITFLSSFLLACVSTDKFDMVDVKAQSDEAQDIVFWAENIALSHIDPFSMISKKDFKKECITSINRVDSFVNKNSDDDAKKNVLFFELQRLDALIGDSHTSIYLNMDVINRMTFFPTSVYFINGKWIVTSTISPNESCLGKAIVSMNGIPIEELVNKISKQISFDNKVWLNGQIPFWMCNETLLNYLGVINAGDKQKLVFDDGSEAEFSSMSYTELQNLSVSPLITNMPMTSAHSDYYLALILSEDCLFVQYNACAEMENYSITQFYNDLSEVVKNNHYNKVIVDLRYNGGGNSRLFEPVIDMLNIEQKAQNFKLYVLIGEGTFSSAILNAIYFRDKTNCVLVGTPTGGSTNHYGEVKTFTLPCSGFTTSYSVKHFIMDKKAPKGSMLPDVVVETTIDDYINVIDAQVEYCLKN